MTEIWKDIEGYEGLYQVSNLGRIKSIIRKYVLKENILSNPIGSSGYPIVNLYKNNIRKTARVHRLVGVAFIPNPDNKRTINHKNGIKTDNRIVNLEWSTYSENNLHAFRVLGRIQSKIWLGKYGINHNRSKPVIQFDKKGNLIAEYSGAAEAGRETEISNSHISRVCNGKLNTAGGFIWRFKHL